MNDEHESIERELFRRRERALVSVPVPRLEDVLRVASVQRPAPRRSRSARPILLVACAAAVAFVGWSLPRLAALPSVATVAPTETIRPEVIASPVQSAAASTSSSYSPASAEDDVCGGEPATDSTGACTSAATCR